MTSLNDAGASPDEAQCHIDTQHLQGLPKFVTTKVDLVLTAHDGSQQVGFPVHQVTIAQHSPVLSSVLDKAQLDDKYFAALSQTLPCIPMVEDSCSAIRTALAFMYTTPPAGASDTSEESCNASSKEPTPQLTLDMISAAASQAGFAHKYGMLELQIAYEVPLLKPLEDAINRLASSVAIVNQVIDCAAAAAKFDLGALLSLCEVFILRHSAHCMNEKPIERLPPSCTLVIARYYYSFAGRKLPSTETMRNFVYEAHLKDPPASQEGSTAIIKCLREQGTAARKLSEMLNCIKPSLQAMLCAAL